MKYRRNWRANSRV